MSIEETECPFVVKLSPEVDRQEWDRIHRAMPVGYAYDSTCHTEYGWVHLCRDLQGKRETLVIPAAKLPGQQQQQQPEESAT